MMRRLADHREEGHTTTPQQEAVYAPASIEALARGNLWRFATLRDAAKATSEVDFNSILENRALLGDRESPWKVLATSVACGNACSTL